MMMKRQRRTGAALVETALIYPILFLLILGIILLGIAVFRYQQVAHAAREGARWAAVHGAEYGEEGASATPPRYAATEADIYNAAILPQLAGMQAANVTYAVTWNNSNKQSHSYVYVDPATGVSRVREMANTVSVTVSYSWNTGLFGDVPVSSTAVMRMSY
jgi:Flp pilus assembly protein TadG